jgi:hypothetical protein
MHFMNSLRGNPGAAATARAWPRFVAVTSSVVLLLGLSAAKAAASTPATAYAFWNSMGINTHLAYSNTPYSRIYEVARRLQQLGIIHIRDGLAPDRPDEIAAFELLAARGIKADLLLGQPGSSPVPLLNVLKQHARNAVESIEGPNEYWMSGAGWQSRLVPFQMTLYRDTHKVLPGLPVVGASVGSVDLIGALDVGNIHPYPGGNEPESNLRSQIARAHAVSGGAPIWATETGYHDAVHMVPGSHQAATTDAAQTIYLPRLFAYYFSQGIQRTYIYELLDEFRDPKRTHPESDFGLLDYGLDPKRQFYAIARLVKAVRDVPNPDPRRLPYDVEDSGPSLRHLLLSRANHTWQLLIWRAEPVNAAGRGPSESAVMLKLPFLSVVTSETPSSSARVRRIGAGVDFRIDVGVALQILSIRRLGQ